MARNIEPVIRATYEIEPSGAADTLAVRASIGMEGGPEWARGRVIDQTDGRATLEFPEGHWGINVSLLMSTLVAGEGSEIGTVSRCRLVDLEFPDGLLPGPAFGPTAQGPTVGIGVIVKPSMGLSPSEVGDVARTAVAGGAVFVKDDEILGDPAWCRRDERVRQVVKAIEPGVVYTPNITGSSVSLVERARRVVGLGATGVMVNAFAQGLDAILALREAELGVPILAHRSGSGALTRNPRFGATGAVLARLCRLCGADYWIVGAFGGALFETDDEVRATLDAVRAPLQAGATSGAAEGAPGAWNGPRATGGPRPAIAAFGGGLGPADVARQAGLAGGDGLLMLLGSQAYRHPGGLEGGVRAAVDAVTRFNR